MKINDSEKVTRTEMLGVLKSFLIICRKKEMYLHVICYEIIRECGQIRLCVDKEFTWLTMRNAL